MPQGMIERYRRWLAYEKDAHEKALGSLETVPPDRRDDPAFRKALDLFAHIVAARLLWLHRLGVLEEGPGTLFGGGLGLEELRGRLDAMHAAWTAYLERLTDADLGTVFEYRALEGDAYRNTIEDILTQLFGHSWYHRGQIAALVRGLGGEPAPTDFVFWTRRPVAD